MLVYNKRGRWGRIENYSEICSLINEAAIFPNPFQFAFQFIEYPDIIIVRLPDGFHLEELEFAQINDGPRVQEPVKHNHGSKIAEIQSYFQRIGNIDGMDLSELPHIVKDCQGIPCRPCFTQLARLPHHIEIAEIIYREIGKFPWKCFFQLEDSIRLRCGDESQLEEDKRYDQSKDHG